MKLGGHRPGSLTVFVDSNTGEPILQVAADPNGEARVAFRLFDCDGNLVSDSDGFQVYPDGLCVECGEEQLLIIPDEPGRQHPVPPLQPGRPSAHVLRWHSDPDPRRPAHRRREGSLPHEVRLSEVTGATQRNRQEEAPAHPGPLLAFGSQRQSSGKGAEAEQALEPGLTVRGDGDGSSWWFAASARANPPASARSAAADGRLRQSVSESARCWPRPRRRRRPHHSPRLRKLKLSALAANARAAPCSALKAAAPTNELLLRQHAAPCQTEVQQTPSVKS